jgi:hypothetical protein
MRAGAACAKARSIAAAGGRGGKVPQAGAPRLQLRVTPAAQRAAGASRLGSAGRRAPFAERPMVPPQAALPGGLLAGPARLHPREFNAAPLAAHHLPTRPAAAAAPVRTGR